MEADRELIKKDTKRCEKNTTIDMDMYDRSHGR